MKHIAFFLLCLLSFAGQAQITYSLDQVVRLAHAQSPSALLAKGFKTNRYWEYKSFTANFKPALSLNGTLPDYNRTIASITQNDGSQLFVKRSYSSSDVGLSISQQIGPTGGTVYLSSRLQRLDLFADTGTVVSYASSPLVIGLNQPLFAFNSLKWDKKIQAIRYEESTKEYNERMESIAIQASNLFFNTLLSQMSLQIAESNLSNNDTIYKIGKGRFSLGTIAENELLQLELNVMLSQQQLRLAKLELENNTLALNTFLGNKQNPNLTLLVPAEPPIIVIDEELAINQAKANRQRFLEFERRRLEGERGLEQAKKGTGLDMNVAATYGLTQTGNNIPNAYYTPLDQQGLRVSFGIPLVDWGRRKAQVQTALSNKEIVDMSVAQDEAQFVSEVRLKVKQFSILRDQLLASAKADTIAQKRYFISQQRYMTSKISITELNVALQQKDQAKRDYLASLREYWAAYYEIRRVTLYDFEKKAPITY